LLDEGATLLTLGSVGDLEQWLADHQFAPLSAVEDVAIHQRIAAAINLMDNTTRGLVGEVLVAHALGGCLMAPWDPWDVSLPSGVKIEVKTTGVVQSWPQLRSSVLTWGIAATTGWLFSNGAYVWDLVRDEGATGTSSPFIIASTGEH
jgi:hypothetical protein